MVFIKGRSGNPNGRPPDALNKAMKKITKIELEEISTLIVKGTVEELQLINEDTESTVIKKMITSIVLKIIEKGDMDAFDKLLNRLIGKVKDEVDLNQTGSEATTVLIQLPDNGRSATH